jgi:hypothetical protein
VFVELEEMKLGILAVLGIGDKLFDGELEMLIRSDLFDKQGLILLGEVEYMVWLFAGSLFGD